jgi:hypothetical protein
MGLGSRSLPNWKSCRKVRTRRCADRRLAAHAAVGMTAQPESDQYRKSLMRSAARSSRQNEPGELQRGIPGSPSKPCVLCFLLTTGIVTAPKLAAPYKALPIQNNVARESLRFSLYLFAPTELRAAGADRARSSALVAAQMMTLRQRAQPL